MPTVVALPEIKKALAGIDPLPLIEEGFVAYSRGQVVVPPVGEILFDDPPGDVHIKSGYIRGDDWYVIKIASGFPDNPKIGLPSGHGLMLLFGRRTGLLEAVLLDEGYLTNLRTAVAGAIVAKVLAPRRIGTAGIVGAGAQGRLQLEWLRRVREFEEAVVWGLDEAELAAYVRDMAPLGLRIRTTRRIEDVPAAADVIITCTPSTTPLLKADWIRPGTHITAIGSDTPVKQELEPAILAKADRVVVDSLSQSELRGEVFRAVQAGAIGREKLVELGQVIADPSLRRASDKEITVADLTGVAVQDVQIAKAVWRAIGA